MRSFVCSALVAALAGGICTAAAGEPSFSDTVAAPSFSDTIFVPGSPGTLDPNGKTLFVHGVRLVGTVVMTYEDGVASLNAVQWLPTPEQQRGPVPPDPAEQRARVEGLRSFFMQAPAIAAAVEKGTDYLTAVKEFDERKSAMLRRALAAYKDNLVRGKAAATQAALAELDPELAVTDTSSDEAPSFSACGVEVYIRGLCWEAYIETPPAPQRVESIPESEAKAGMALIRTYLSGSGPALIIYSGSGYVFLGNENARSGIAQIARSLKKNAYQEEPVLSDGMVNEILAANAKK